jgi:nucleotidyltransferase substrate binding protein (TIGR01987 family)
MEDDIRWQQRFFNYSKALHKLHQAIDYIAKTEDDQSEDTRAELMKEGIIQRFEYVYELAWNVMKDYAFYQGNTEVKGSRDAIRTAWKMALIEDGEVWMDMIKSRQETAHNYDETTVREVYQKIVSAYFPAFILFKHRMDHLQTPPEVA